jgi:hypothetical protein
MLAIVINTKVVHKFFFLANACSFIISPVVLAITIDHIYSPGHTGTCTAVT